MLENESATMLAIAEATDRIRSQLGYRYVPAIHLICGPLAGSIIQKFEDFHHADPFVRNHTTNLGDQVRFIGTLPPDIRVLVDEKFESTTMRVMGPGDPIHDGDPIFEEVIHPHG